MLKFRKLKAAVAVALCVFCAAFVPGAYGAVTDADVPVFIVLGQSNADGSAMFDATLDSALEQWYTSDANTGKMKIWYKSTYVQNQASNALGEAARWALDGTVTDAEPGWMDLWYRNENDRNRTAMNMIHGYGTWSTGTGTDCAQGRRGMEGAFGRAFATALPSSELYVLKLGVSGSFISSWADPADDTNWNYFYRNVFKPAMADLLAKGKRPRLAGVWWMQGCADRNASEAYYQVALERLVDRVNSELGFADGKVYVGHIVKPGESTVTPAGSVQYGQGVRDAQDAVAASAPRVVIVDTKDFPLQYEASFGGKIHFDHAGVNAIGEDLAARVIADGADGWAEFSTPGKWTRTASGAVFTPAFGNPEISYSTEGNVVTATLVYPGFTDVKTYELTDEAQSSSPGYLDLDGSRYMVISNCDEFNIAARGTLTVALKARINTNKTQTFITNRVRNYEGGNNNDVSGWAIYNVPGTTTTSFNYPGTSWTARHHNGTGISTGDWHHLCWVYAGDRASFYIDGVAVGTPPSINNAAIPSYCDVLVGAGYTMTDGHKFSIDELNNFVEGAIDDVRIYRDALSADEVTADGAATSPLEGKNVIAAYDFTELTGTNCPDITGNGHNGRLVNFPDYSSTGSVLTVETPEEGTGTLTVYNGDEAVISGSRVEDGTELRVEAVAAPDYNLTAILVNGAPIEGNTFVMNGATTVSATFERDASAPTKVLVFDMNEAGSKYYRIPALVTAADGSLVALADKRGDSLGDLPNTISVVCKRSTDGGATWSEAVTVAQGDAATGKTYGDPALILDRNTGNLVAVFSGDTGFFVSTKTNRAGFYVSVSEDNGLTWSEPRAVTDQIYQPEWYGAFAASGRMLQTKSGRIMFAANARLSSAQYLTQVYEFVVASDDGGQTWTVLNPDSRIPSDGQGNESKLVELSDGTLIMSIRSSGKRRFARSTDGGTTWTDAAFVNDLPEPSCNGDIIVYPSTDGQNRLLHSLPANSSTRRDVSVFMSYDEGSTWPVKKKLIDGLSAYSSLTVLPDGTIGCFVEEGKWDSSLPGDDGFRLYFMKFTLDWLTDGADVPETDPVYDGTLNLDGTRYMVIPNCDEFNIPARGTLTVSLKARINDNSTQTFITNRVRNYENGNNNDVSGWAIYNVPGTTSTSFNYPGSSWTARHHNATGISTGDWHHLCWVYAGDRASFYIDGVAVGTPPAINNAAIPSYCDVLVGAGYTMSDGHKFSPDNLNNYVDGAIDDVRIYRDALTSDEVASDLAATAPLEGKNVIAAYDFAEIKGVEVTDLTGNGHTGRLVNFPERGAETYKITIETPDEAKGTLAVYDGETRIYSGREVEAGTELRVEAEGVSPYIPTAIYVNDTALDEGVNTFTVEGPTTVSALFELDPSLPVSYQEPSGDGASQANCYVELATTEGAEQNISIERTAKLGTNYELCDEQTIRVRPGQTFTLNLKAKKTNTSTTTVPSPQDLRYCVAYVFADWNADGEFDIQTPSNPTFADSYYYGYNSGAASTLFNNVKANYDHTLDIAHSFTVPTDAPAKLTRIRVIYTEAWDGNIRNGSAPALISGNYQSINKGYAYDYLVECVSGPSAIDGIATDDSDAPVEYYNLQGIRVSGDNLVPGFYIVRQGNTARKVLIGK